MRPSPIRRRAIDGLEVGDVFEVSRIFTPGDVAAFEAISRDHNPVHSSHAFAESKGFEGTVCHGLLVASMLTEIGGQLGWLATGIDLRFRRPVYPGVEIACRCEVMAIEPGLSATAEIRFTDSGGEVVLEATIKGRLPTPAERAIMTDLPGP